MRVNFYHIIDYCYLHNISEETSLKSGTCIFKNLDFNKQINTLCQTHHTTLSMGKGIIKGPADNCIYICVCVSVCVCLCVRPQARICHLYCSLTDCLVLNGFSHRLWLYI